ncbi:hypothetical protein E2C01_096624 [Portunus trituberculatus]|uniref:Uncharacterized protein n=1 Tax=Portunus trituberculatus TaxID=210409 RepID=A0A5B7JW44_PORTR|nr:hypothetical protein [Portunus trituberculatus]
MSSYDIRNDDSAHTAEKVAKVSVVHAASLSLHPLS